MATPTTLNRLKSLPPPPSSSSSSSSSPTSLFRFQISESYGKESFSPEEEAKKISEYNITQLTDYVTQCDFGMLKHLVELTAYRAGGLFHKIISNVSSEQLGKLCESCPEESLVQSFVQLEPEKQMVIYSAMSLSQAQLIVPNMLQELSLKAWIKHASISEKTEAFVSKISLFNLKQIVFIASTLIKTGNMELLEAMIPHLEIGVLNQVFDLLDNVSSIQRIFYAITPMQEKEIISTFEERKPSYFSNLQIAVAVTTGTLSRLIDTRELSGRRLMTYLARCSHQDFGAFIEISEFSKFNPKFSEFSAIIADLSLTHFEAVYIYKKTVEELAMALLFTPGDAIAPCLNHIKDQECFERLVTSLSDFQLHAIATTNLESEKYEELVKYCNGFILKSLHSLAPSIISLTDCLDRSPSSFIEIIKNLSKTALVLSMGNRELRECILSSVDKLGLAQLEILAPLMKFDEFANALFCVYPNVDKGKILEFRLLSGVSLDFLKKRVRIFSHSVENLGREVHDSMLVFLEEPNVVREVQDKKTAENLENWSSKVDDFVKCLAKIALVEKCESRLLDEELTRDVALLKRSGFIMLERIVSAVNTNAYFILPEQSGYRERVQAVKAKFERYFLT